MISKKRGFIMDLTKNLYIVHSKGKDKKPIKNSPPSIENDNWMAIYEDIEKVINGKKPSSLDIDVHLLMNRLM